MSVPSCDGLKPRPDSPDDLLVGGRQHPVLGREVVLDRPDGDLRARGDLADAHLVQATLGHDVQQRVGDGGLFRYWA